MRYEKELLREDKSRVLITVRTWMDGFGDSALKYDVSVATKQPRKRTWIHLNFSDNYTFRALSMEDRKKFMYNEQLKIVTKEEIQTAKIEAWELLKPEGIVC